ncbi:MAG: hypothetical protein LBL66_09675, partial [Clostridiales bacterium]|nr:hypothetical protein [Clostridiales bacterium]
SCCLGNHPAAVGGTPPLRGIFIWSEISRLRSDHDIIMHNAQFTMHNYSPQCTVHSAQLRSSCFGNHPAAVGGTPPREGNFFSGGGFLDFARNDRSLRAGRSSVRGRSPAR